VRAQFFFKTGFFKSSPLPTKSFFCIVLGTAGTLERLPTLSLANIVFRSSAPVAGHAIVNGSIERRPSHGGSMLCQRAVERKWR
jgi:hypothetical protein